MSRLREKHKADRDRRIIAAASTLFRETGYERSNIEAIAARAEVSIGTIYNYYQNKGDLLLAVVALEVNEVLNAGEGLIEHPPSEAAQAIGALIATYLEHSLVYLSKEMWRHAMAISTQQPESPSGRTYTDLDRRLADQVCRLIRRLQQGGGIDPRTEARSAGELIFNNTNMMFATFVKTESMTVEELKEAIARQNAVLLALIAR